MKLIGISGKAGSGKDTVGKIIRIITDSPHFTNKAVVEFLERDLYPGKFEIKKFATKVKQIVALLISCTLEDLEDRKFKEKVLPEDWWYWKMTHEGGFPTTLIPFGSKKVEKKSEDTIVYKEVEYSGIQLIRPTPRLLMQQVGTECGRQILHPKLWINALMSEVKEDSNWIITDVRFPDEADAIKEKGGILIRLSRPNLIENNHLSETSLDSSTFDFIISNDKDINHLINEVRKILEKLNII